MSINQKFLQTVGAAQTLYIRLSHFSNQLKNTYEKTREIFYDFDARTLALRLGEGTIVRFNQERDEWDVYFAANFLKRRYLKAGYGLSESAARALVANGPDSLWHIDGETHTTFDDDSPEAQQWINNFLETKKDVKF